MDRRRYCMYTVLIFVLFVCWSITVDALDNRAINKEKPLWRTLFFSTQAREQNAKYPPVQVSVKYQGILHSQGKPSTYWINDTMQQVLPKSVLIQHNQLVVLEGGKQIKLSPGEAYNMAEQNVDVSSVGEKER